MQKLVQFKKPKRLLTPTSGFLSGYSHSLNPYTGCAFACSFCYVRQSPVGMFRKQEWGTWIDVKQATKEQLQKEVRHLKKQGKTVTIFMSSATDPYQPLEYKEKITRTLLEALVEEPPHFLFIQTRSPLVTRDRELIAQLKEHVRVSMTVETDREDIRKVFSPEAPPIQARLKAIRQLNELGIQTQVALAPVLPFSEAFPKILANTTEGVVIDDFITGDGSNGKRTERLRIKEIYEQLGMEWWYGEGTAQMAYERMKESFTEEQLLLSKAGFSPN
ncbi:radical SAM protein [Bacillus sp. JCM 19034]|uniref:SPL family radical SAM protein n=1 Tax=Bacillus sp. JCM 19034 TaxID=1481928 RepID=UPI0007812958|nr:radical SAM protein [Bacillus sp. JCM 19034]